MNDNQATASAGLTRRILLALAIFLIVVGAKLVVIERSGTDLPFWDQWAKEGELMHAPWLERGELWSNLFVPHNEHRIAPTLAANLALVATTGQWDARVQSVISGGLHALLLAGLFFWGSAQVEKRHVFALACLAAVTGAAPISWENLLSGFQSQFYFLALFSLGAIGGLLLSRAWTLIWWLGLASGLLALVSMGSGLLCAAPIAGVALVRLVAHRDAWRAHLATLLAGLALGGAGWLLHTPTPWHEPLHARSFAVLATYAARCLAWPSHDRIWLAAVIWVPWLALAVSWLWRRARGERAGRAQDFVVAAGLWILAQVMAVSYSRAGAGGPPANRYGDLFALALPLSFLALAWLLPANRLARKVVLAWLLVVVVTLTWAAHGAWVGPLADKQREHRTYERNVAAFVQTDDYASFEKQLPDLPFPIADWLARILRRPSIRAILPASVRRPVAIKDLADHVATPAPALPHRATRALLSSGEWRSEVLPAGRGWWKFETAGNLGFPGCSLRLIAVADGRTLATIAPSKAAGPSWRAAYVPAPAEPARLVATNDGSGRWCAFSEPVEMSATSYEFWRLTKLGPWIIAAGALLALLTALSRSAPRSYR